MKKHAIATVVACTLATVAFAQADTTSHNPIVKSPTAHTAAAAARGRNSFTETQAQGRIAKAGYSDVSKLMKNENGVWQGTAMKDGAKVNVGLDYKGNVTAR